MIDVYDTDDIVDWIDSQLASIGKYLPNKSAKLKNAWIVGSVAKGIKKRPHDVDIWAEVVPEPETSLNILSSALTGSDYQVSTSQGRKALDVYITDRPPPSNYKAIPIYNAEQAAREDEE